MKRISALSLLLFFGCACLYAQDVSSERNEMVLRALTATWHPETSESRDAGVVRDSLCTARADTLYCNTDIQVDSTLLGKTIFDVLPSREKGDVGNVAVSQSTSLLRAFQRHIDDAQYKELSGYRVRIYFSNAQNAREASMAAAQLFQSHFGGYNVYRNFVNPNFKVTVGDFRTKSEALAFLEAVRADFPAAFIVRENIHYAY